MENWHPTRLCWGSGEGRRWGKRECYFSMLSGTGCSRLTGLRWLSPERGRLPRPWLGQKSLSVRLDLYESNGGHQSDDALQDLVDLTRP